MKIEGNHELERASAWCDALRNGCASALNDLQEEYGLVLKLYLAKRLHKHCFWLANKDDILEESLQNFWCDLFEKQFICNYQARRGASLLTFFQNVLWNKARDLIRVELKCVHEPEEFEESKSAQNAIACFDSPDDHFNSKEQQRLLKKLHNEVLLQLSSVYPERARILQLRTEHELSYREIAHSLYSSQKTAGDLLREESRLRQVYTRAKKDYIKLFNQMLVRKNLELSFQDGKPVFHDAKWLK